MRRRRSIAARSCRGGPSATAAARRWCGWSSADAFIASADCVELEGSSLAAGIAHFPARYSTPDMLSCERRLLELALVRRGEHAGVVPARAREAAIAARPTLSTEQAELVRSLVGSGDGIEVVRAAAGTGKTYALDAGREAWEREGLCVIGAALSARAAELRDCAGIDSVTTAQLLWDLERGFSLTDRHVVVVDEAGMVGTRQLERIAAASVDGGAKLVLVGDDRQLPEIEAGGAFRALADSLGARELTEVRRQRDEWERATLSELGAGRPERWLRESTERGRIWVAKGREEQVGALVGDWWQARAELGEEQAVMLAYRRRDVAELNGRARAYMRAAGRLGGPELRVGERGFSAGDRVLCTQNGCPLGVLNGDRGTVTAVDERSRSLRVSLDSGKEALLPPGYLEQGGLDHGYAVTVHKSQGMSIERTFVLGSEDLYAELGYTALSRHRDSCRFYIDAGDPPRRERLPGPEAQPDPLEPVVRALGESRAKEPR